MKLYLLIALAICLLSCSKENLSSVLSGKWNLVLDTTYVGAAAGNHAEIYNGTPADNFNFSGSNKLYITEKGEMKTLNYSVVSNNSVAIQSFYSTDGSYDTCSVIHLSNNEINITTGIFPSPGGTFGRTIYLSR